MLLISVSLVIPSVFPLPDPQFVSTRTIPGSMYTRH